jgi:hypothetical protein
MVSYICKRLCNCRGVLVLIVPLALLVCAHNRKLVDVQLDAQLVDKLLTSKQCILHIGTPTSCKLDQR